MQHGECRATLNDHFFFSDYEAMHKLALMLRHLPLSLRDAYTFAISPADPDDPIIASALLSFATAYCQRWGVIDLHLQPCIAGSTSNGNASCLVEYVLCERANILALWKHLPRRMAGFACWATCNVNSRSGGYMVHIKLLCCPLQQV